MTASADAASLISAKVQGGFDRLSCVGVAHAPIALFTYNRPRHTARVVESLLRNREAAQSELHVFCDAARSPLDDARVQAVRQYVRALRGFRSVQVVERERNFGLAGSIVDGVTALCARHGRAIVLEDDIEVSAFFLRYVNEALDRYAADERVMSIGCYAFPLAGRLPETFFLRLPDCWGWGVWKRSWDHYEADGAALLGEIRRRGLEREFDLDGSYGYSRMLEDQVAGRNDSWAVRWYAKVFLRGGLTLYPGRSVTRNIGMDGSGVHNDTTHAYDVDLQDRPVRLEEIPVAEDLAARAEIAAFFRRARRPRWLAWTSGWKSPFRR